MQITGAGRVVFIAQWIAAVVLPIWFFLGRGLVGAQLGSLWLAALVYGIFVAVVLAVPPVLTLFDSEVRTARSTRTAYSVVSWVLWIAALAAALVVPDQSEGEPLDPALTVWTGGAISASTSEIVFIVLSAVIGLAYLTVFILAIAGVSRSRTLDV
ncbi:hypothetical protein [Microbacterium sp.]|uniref:hypothetical protein n=1 Tax=Microbacterium sp. TaxID=51671 RepID=UPI0037C72C88